MPAVSRRAWAGVGVLSLAAALTWNPAQADQPTPSDLSATALSATAVVTAPKSTSGRLAQSDRALLRRTDSALVDVVVKLDYDASASYRGTLKGLPATSPSVTRQRLSGRSAAERRYTAYVAGRERTFETALRAKVPSARIGHRLRVVYGGVSLRLPAAQAKVLLTLPGVAAVQSDTLAHPDATPRTASTVESPTFIGAPTIWKQVGGQALAGRGIIFADLDTGIWPEHPMLANNPALGAPPATPSGQPRACTFGDNPLTPATDTFVCNDKVIGGQAFLQTYAANNPPEVYGDTARDSDGHGTHTTTTTAGDPVVNALDLGVDRGPVSGVAPGAWVMEYKVCGVTGCYGSDTAAATQQAILDGASVINYSIGGGSSPFSDPTELAFLDAYNAGVFVAASAGNSGPGAATTEHRGPWVTTVAASTQRRAFTSTLTVTGDGQTATFPGTTLTAGVTASTAIVRAQDLPGYDALCSSPMPPGLAVGKIVACQRGGNGRVEKGFNVKAGGAAGMVLYNLPLADVESDNHFLPAIHLADGTQLLAFLAAHPGALASFPAGVKSNGQADVMASFSSRGPGGTFLKPDITAPGIQVLAGASPTPDEVASGPAGQYYQAIAGTSMAAPHIAGSALLLKALHPAWTPGAIRSALMTTARTQVVKEDLTTAADPFDDGAGRVDLTVAGRASVVFDESATRMATLGNNPLTAADLNLPSVNLPTMPGSVTVTRTATNVSGRPYLFAAATRAPAGARITVTPALGVIPAGQSRALRITVTSTATSGQFFGEVRLLSPTNPLVHLPVAFAARQGASTLTQSCTPASLAVGATTTCTVTTQNTATTPATVVATSTVSSGLRVVGATGATVAGTGRSAVAGPTVLAPPRDASPAIAPGSTPAGGYRGLENFGIAPQPVGDEESVTFTVPAFTFGGVSYDEIGVVSDGYIVLGGATSSDVTFTPQNLPDPARPNGVLAPYWTDLDGTGAPGVRAASLTDGVSTWVVVQWNVHLYGDASPGGTRAMQVWIGTGGAEDVSYAYDAATLGLGTPAGYGLTVGAENVSGTAGAQIGGPPSQSYRVTTSPGEPGESLTYTLTVKGTRAGHQLLATELQSDVVAGTTRVSTPVEVTWN